MRTHALLVGPIARPLGLARTGSCSDPCRTPNSCARKLMPNRSFVDAVQWACRWRFTTFQTVVFSSSLHQHGRTLCCVPRWISLDRESLQSRALPTVHLAQMWLGRHHDLWARVRCHAVCARARVCVCLRAACVCGMQRNASDRISMR